MKNLKFAKPVKSAIFGKAAAAHDWESYDNISKYKEPDSFSKSSIIKIEEPDLLICLAVIQNSFMTVASEFGLTEQNCPTNGAFMQFDWLKYDFDNGDLMFGYNFNGNIIGFMQLSQKSDDVYELKKLAVMPEFRHNSYGRQLIDFAALKVRELGGSIISIGIIEDNTRLKNWYTQYGFVHTGTSIFPNLPFTVGFMELRLAAKG